MPYFTFGTAGIYNNLVPYRFTQGGTAADEFKPAVVRVAANATLDTTYIPDANLSFGALVVDVAAGGGTITKFSPAVGGVLDLVNVPAGKRLKGYTVPITVDSAVNASNLATWTIRANGQLLKGYYLTVSGDHLVLHGGGLVVNLR